MGLPIWRAPSPADQRAQAIKNDASAAARSPIRRSSPTSARPARNSARNDANVWTRRYINLSELAARRDHRAAEPDTERDPERRSQERRQAELSSVADGWLIDFDRLAAVASESSEQTDSPEERVHLYISTDGPSIRASRFGPNHPENNPFARALPAAPERDSSSGPDRARTQDSSERSRLVSRSADILSRMSARRRRTWSNRAQEPLGELPRHTYRRAPTNWPFSSDSADADDDSPPTDGGRELAEATRDLPPLRRMGRRQVTDGLLPSSSLRQSWSPSGTIDGLGDRERSLSPPADPWETMLTTITPDTQLPSADSSFTSAAVSASFSTSNNSQDGSNSSRADSTSSPNTQLTVPSRRQSPDEASSLLPQRACDTDDDLSGNDTESDERPSMSRSRAQAGRYRPYTTSFRQPQDGPPSRNPGAYPSSVRSRSRDATTFVRSYFAFADREPPSSLARPPPSPPAIPPAPRLTLPRFPRLHREDSSGVERSVENRRDSGVGSDGPREFNLASGPPRLADFLGETARSSSSSSSSSSFLGGGQLDPELESMRDILGRLARRDDVPEEFWLSAGLAPPMLEGLGRRERERL